MIIGDRVPFSKENCTRFKDCHYNKDDKGCLFGNVVSYDKEMVCISYMCQLYFVKRSDIEKMINEIEN